jgi:phytoene dehydrogenase-like protein
MVLLGLAHLTGWPFPHGGAQSLADTFGARLRELSGEIRTGHTVTSLTDLPRLLHAEAHATVSASGQLTPQELSFKPECR